MKIDWKAVAEAVNDHLEHGHGRMNAGRAERMLGHLIGQPEPGSIPAAKVRGAVEWFIKKQGTSAEERNGIRKFCNELGVDLNDNPKPKEPELLPCGKCGDAGELYLGQDPSPPFWFCRCDRGCVNVFAATREQAIARWNWRDGK